MLYQKILSNEQPYCIGIGHMSPFQEHRHADFELNFCVEGSFDILADKKRFSVGADYLKIENVEKALELIYYNYKEALSVERVAALTGYSKSNFCKIFQKVVGGELPPGAQPPAREQCGGTFAACSRPSTASPPGSIAVRVQRSILRLLEVL